MDDKNSIDGPASPVSPTSQVVNDVNDLMFDFNDGNDPSNNSSRRDSVASPTEENTGTMLSRRGSLRTGLHLAVSNSDFTTRRGSAPAIHFGSNSLLNIGNTIDGLRSG